MSETQNPQVAALPATPDDTSPETEATTAPAASEAPAGQGEPLDAVRAQRDEYYDLLLRKTAEFDNYRRRTERERRDAGDRAVAEFVTDLLQVVDDLERAAGTEAAGGGVDAYREGIHLIRRRLADLLAKRGVTPVDPLGEDFDPHVHEAVVREHDPTRRDGEVVEVLAKGYRMGDRLLRPAMVKVAAS
jgi:molecular chaperone GrpE